VSFDHLHPRVVFDLNARSQVFGPDAVIEVAAGSEEFWNWYARTVRFGRPFQLVPVADAPPYPAATRGTAIWFSGGVESTYTLEEIRSTDPVVLRIEDYPVFESEHRRIGQIHFLCTALGSALGFSRIYMGVERNDLLLANNSLSRLYVERTPAFLEAWSRYQPDHAAVSVCGHLHKEEIIRSLYERRLAITGTCDRYRGGRWCGDCFKCFEAYFSAKAVGIDLGIRLTPRAFSEYHGEYRSYLDSGFTDNFNNAYQHFLRLQVMYHLKFEPQRDCRGGSDGTGA
jgi:hypothetical protein